MPTLQGFLYEMSSISHVRDIIGSIYEDVTSDVLGQIGTWQWMVTVLATILMASSMFNQNEDMFLLEYSANIVCLSPIGNSTECNRVKTDNVTLCNMWNVNILGMFWIKKTWVMACDHSWKVLSTAMVCRLGVMFGCIVFGLIADSFGRKKAMIMTVLSNTILKITILVCDSENWYKLLVFVRSLLGSANNFMGLILVCEIASNRWRSWLSMIVISPQLLAAVSMVPLARAAGNSESYTFVACIYNVLMFIVLRWTPESPHWLLFNNGVLKAENIIYEAAKLNRVPLCSEFKIRPIDQRAYFSLDEDQSCIPVLSTHNTKVITIVSLIFWILISYAWSIVYATLYNQNMHHLYLLKITLFAAIIGSLTILLSLKCKLRHLLMLDVFLTGVCGVAALVFVEIREPIFSILFSLALAAHLNMLAITLIIMPRLFAIKIRATFIGCCLAVGQIGAILGYLIAILKLLDGLTVALLQGSVAVVMMVLCLVFPDVDGRELPDVTYDMDYFSELTKPMRWATQKTHSPSHEEIEIRNTSFSSARAPVSYAEPAPAHPIGYKTLWRRAIDCVTRCFYCLICTYNKQ